MSDDHLLLDKDGDLAWLVLNRPEKRNALSHEMWQRIPALIDDVENDPAVRVLIVRGIDERAFSAGADISEFTTHRATEEGARNAGEVTEAAQARLADLSKPAIAMVQGPCVGGACGLAIACDFRFADHTGLFGITPSTLGIVYTLSATKRLVDLVGPARAKYLLFSGRKLDAEAGRAIGLVDDVFEPDDLEARVVEFARTLASRAQYSIRGTKRIVRLIMDGVVEENEESVRLNLDSYGTDDFREGVQAFLEKRPAKFTYS